MKPEKTFILRPETAIELFTALCNRIETGCLPSTKEGILNALDFYQDYFTHYQEIGDTGLKNQASRLLNLIPTMRTTLDWRKQRADAIFFSDL